MLPQLHLLTQHDKATVKHVYTHCTFNGHTVYLAVVELLGNKNWLKMRRNKYVGT